MLIDLLDFAVKDFVREGINANFRLLADFDMADLGFWNVNADVNLIGLEQRGDRCVRSDKIAGAYIKDFNDRVSRGDDFALAETRFVVGKRGLGSFDVLAAIAALEFFQRGLRLLIAGFRRGDFFRAIPAPQLVKLLLRVLDHCYSHSPGSFGGIELLLGD